MSTELEPSFANIYIAPPCEEGQAAMSDSGQTIGEFFESDFAKTEQGKKVGNVLLSNIENAQKLVEISGMDEDKAIIIAFGGVTVIDETGRLARKPEAPTPVSDESHRAEKKYPRIFGHRTR